MLTDFLKDFKSVVLSTINTDSSPFTSYAPFIKVNAKYYVYLSAMARHTQNLDNNNQVSLFFIEDETSCANIFARKRVVLQSNAKKLPRDTKEFEKLIEIFEKEHGSTMKMLKKMKDFSVYEFTPYGGEAVFGFGDAYDIGGETFEELVERQGQAGHK